MRSTLPPRPGPRNVAHCIHGLGLGGAQKVIAALARGRRSDARRTFIYSCHDGVQRREMEHAGATVRIISRHIARFDPLWAVRLARAMRRDRIDLVHTHLFGDSLHGYLGAQVAGGVPVVMTLHTRPEGLTGVQRRGYRWLLRRSSAAVACSRAVHRAFTGQGFAARRWFTIANGLEPPAEELPAARRRELRTALGATPETVLIAAVGRLAAEKGYSHLIAALAEVRAGSDVRLLLVGDGPLRNALETQARASDLGRRVTFTGVRSDVPELLQAVDVVAFSSLWEGLPMVLLEAMAARRCIVTTDVPGILEAVRDGREALVVPVGNAGALAAALEQAVSDAGLRERLAATARRRFEAEFTAGAMVRAYEAVYREACSRAATDRAGR